MRLLPFLKLALAFVPAVVMAQEPEVMEEELALREGDWSQLVVTLKGGKKVTYERADVVRVQYVTKKSSSGSGAAAGTGWMGKVWRMREAAPDGRYCDAVWTRQGTTSRFSGAWTCSWGARVSDTLVVQPLSGDRVVVHREGLNRNYTGTLSSDRRSINGKGWDSGGTWTVRIE